MPRAHLSVDTQRVVIERAHSRCEYCQSQADYATETFAVEHIQPISQGGGNDLNNLALSCSGCNGRKYNKTEAPDPPMVLWLRSSTQENNNGAVSRVQAAFLTLRFLIPRCFPLAPGVIWIFTVPLKAETARTRVFQLDVLRFA